MPQQPLSMSEKKKQKRAAILKAAIKVFSEKGFAETTIAVIAKEARVSFGTVFTYFETKEILYEKAVLEPLDEIKPYFLKVDDYFSGTPLEKIQQMIETHVDLFSERSEFLRLIQQVLGRPERFPKLFEELDLFVDDFVNIISPTIEEGQRQGVFYEETPALMAQSYLAILNGMRLTYINESTHSLWNALTVQALRLFGPIIKN
ncbi:TetR/AcrR family transcriptional regulator [Bacillus salacetis]|uniref:TetR/AcrR family transcriptional regulator n=1 Tax=Bacillus salacetis TaxID=2315464 RepID=A0A3A1QVU6_9BACI|nr:TetR/AcrR family transcriptional regulator [Bacillus salacetis]RIW29586.1 TetR/AcrR family transcriptional regulator [Bacillus salacetis]